MSRFHALTVAEVRRETADSVSVRLAVPDRLKQAFAFRPGQYLTLRATIGGEELRRSYSICSGLDDGDLRVGIKKVKGGAFSCFANNDLKPGDTLDVMPPEGRFTPAPADGPRHILGIAAGSGITPVLSIVKSVLAREPGTRVSLIYGNGHSAGVMFAEEIEDLKNRHLGRLSVVHVLSREAQDVELLSGRIDAAKLRALAAGPLDLASVTDAFLCGPQGLVTAAREGLAALGLPPERIHAELFTAAVPRRNFTPLSEAAAAAVRAEITVTLDGRRHVFPMLAGDATVIDAAGRIGLDLPFSCKGGMCCTCRARVTAGAAEMTVNYSLEEWEMREGFTLACQAQPATPQLALDFDAI
jgi:ring-1,2-phenylacetyl-CoA epoxidase subunit PaaE